jgi:cell wall-associated NlpC family hydrolase
MLWVYSQLGLQIPRTAQQQFEWAMSIEPAHLQPGDLAFYENTYTLPDRITHVGIYVGNGTLVMATSAGDFVQEVPLSNPYWSAHFVSVGRPPYWQASA